MPATPVFTKYSVLTLRTTSRDLLFLVPRFEYCVQTLISFFLSVLIGALSRFRRAFPRVVDLVSEGVLFPISFRVPEFVDTKELYQIIGKCASEMFMAFQAYHHNTKIF